jgi:phytoene/squalene synthetase
VRIDEESAGRSAAATRALGAELEEAKMECSYAVMSLAALGVLTLGSAIVFAVMTIFALRRELPDMVGPHVFALPGDAVLTWQVGELMFDLAGRMQKGEPIEGALLEVSRALHRVAERFPQLLRGKS